MSDEVCLFRAWVNVVYMAFTRSKFWTINCRTGSSGFGSEVASTGSSRVWVFGVTKGVVFGWLASSSMGVRSG